ncbi:MAG: hypothetical protein CME93_05215 [Hyphomonadaceae bacterium]|nr:hypothetical protein [Hyphomonadaceae bacterium]
MANFRPALACIGFSYYRLVRFKAELLAFRRLCGSLTSPLIRPGCPGQERVLLVPIMFGLQLSSLRWRLRAVGGRAGACPPVSRFGVYLT